jgi:hypothetical protein
MNNIFDDYYFNIYNNILNISNDNENILSFDQNSYNVLNDFSYIIKKKNINIDIVIFNNKLVYYSLLNDIINEECYDKLKIIKNFPSDKINYYNKIIIFHLYSIEKLKTYILNTNNLLKKGGFIYIYGTLSDNNNKIYYKNIIRDIFNKNIGNSIGNVINQNELLETINEFLSYKLISIKIYKNSNYIIYGSNNIYEIILEKIV